LIASPLVPSSASYTTFNAISKTLPFSSFRIAVNSLAFPSYTNDSGAVSSIEVYIFVIENSTIVLFPVISVAIKVYSPFSLIVVPLVNSSPFKVTLTKLASVITGVTELV